MPDGICSVPDCGEPIRSLTYCRFHYGRYNRWGDPLAGRIAKGIKDSICSIDGCNSPEKIRGWCLRHYTRWHRYGDPLLMKRQDPMEPRAYYYENLKIKQDECKIWPYSKDVNGYPLLQIAGIRYRVHRLACAEENGPCPEPTWEAAHGKDRRCESVACWNGAHLEWQPHSKNMETLDRDGTRVVGEKVKRAKLTADNVREIRRRRASGESRKDLAIEFNVHPEHITLIVRRGSWKHVK